MFGRSPRTALLATAAALALAGGLLTGAAAAPAPQADGEAAAAPAAALPALHTQGNRIVNAAGTPVTLRGLSILAPEQNDVCTDCNSKPINELIDMTISDGWESKVLRLLVTEVLGKDLAAYDAQYIRPYVDYAVSKGLYVIIDLHLVRNYGDTAGAVPQSQVKQFWDYIAPRYGNNPNVLFEVFNEPINPDSWATWKTYIQPVVDSIRTVSDNVILMGSPAWSTRLNGARTNPITGGNIAYVYHLYPNQGPASAANLDPKFGNAAAEIPVVLTEFGWDPVQPPHPVTGGTTSGWGLPLRQYLDARPHIGWTAWIFDNFWAPVMFDKNWNLLGGEHQGAFVRDWLAGAPATSPCNTHLARGATATASSTLNANAAAARAVDGSCTDDGRWMSAEGDATPTLTINLGQYRSVDQIDVYSGYRWPATVADTILVDFRVEAHTSAGWVTAATIADNTKAVVSVAAPAASIDQVRLVITDPSNNAVDIARVYEVALH
ncbi:cellulase family glycosylhydrolase [Jiangella alkaliphila]|uniref:cellulase n=1 Tax=Jiangella alkaliphila TaxID=419479 RepID=A0A1H2JW96_9ACTN|nr:cellulase family glycosylhydrolase [Jiangella alkaliphila]SDU60416.1 F5/8 type C domain-containing protein [Jiangella alkaliphila]